jgi:hypothetical protein
MHITVDVLLIVGLILNFVKAGDLILRPHQLKWFQDRFEHMTLWLDFTKPLKALKTLTSDDGRLALLVLGYVPAIFVLAATQAPQASEPKGISLITYLNFGILIFLIKKGLPITRWLFGDGRVTSFLKRFMLLSIGQLVALVCLVLSVRLIVYLSDHSNEHFLLGALFVVDILVLLALALLNLVYSTIWLACFLTIVASSILLIFEILLRFARGIAWRIVEYNKGAFAAIVLIVTVALGLIDFYLKFYK